TTWYRLKLSTSGTAALGSRALSAETREVYHKLVDFLKFAAKELAERELGQRRAEQDFHRARLADESLGKLERASFKTGQKEIEKLLERDKAPDVLTGAGLPALAAMLGPASEADAAKAANAMRPPAGLS